MRQARRHTYILLVTAGLIAGSARAQPPESPPATPPAPPSSSLIQKPSWSLTGDLGVVGELYRIDGRDKRRPGETGRMYLRPTFALADRYTIRSEFLLSTEGSSALARQSLNQYMINPSWKWRDTRYSARIGDFSDAYTPTTFNGVQVRGGELAMQRERMLVSVLGGRTKPATEGGPDGGSYRQTLFAGRVGVGDDTRAATAFVLYAADDRNSLPALPDTAAVLDSTEVGTVINPYAVTPQENLVVSTWGQVSVLDRRLSLAGELSRSSYTRDRRAADAGSGRVDFAVDTKARYGRKGLELTGGYKRIGPGFVSLGVASMHSDQQEFLAGGSVRIGASTSLRAQASRQNDNLANDKIATTTRYRYVTALSLRPTRRWTAVFSGNHVTMANDAASDSSRVDFRAWILGMNHVFSFGYRSLLQSVSLQYTAQASRDGNPLRQTSDATSHTARVSTLVRASRNLTVAPALGLTRVQTNAQGWRTTTTYALAMQHRALAQRLMTTLSVSASTAAGDASIATTLGSRYSVTRSDALELRLATNHFRRASGSTAGEPNYDEVTTHVGWTRRF